MRVAEVTQTPRKSDNEGDMMSGRHDLIGHVYVERRTILHFFLLFLFSSVGFLDSQLGWEAEDILILFSQMGGIALSVRMYEEGGWVKE